MYSQIRSKTGGRNWTRQPSSGIAFALLKDAASHPHREYSSPPSIPFTHAREPSRYSGLFAARISSLASTSLSRVLFARWAKPFRCCDRFRWGGVGRGRNRAAIDSPQTHRANHHCGNCKYRPGSHSRIRPDTWHHRYQRKKEKAQSRSGSEVREIFDPGVKTVHRLKVSDQAGSRIYRTGRVVSGR